MSSTAGTASNIAQGGLTIEATSKHPVVLSAAEKHLDYEVELMKNRDPGEFYAFLRRMDFWYRANRSRITSMLYLMAGDKKRVPYESVKRALLDLDVPCSRVEMHAMCIQLDRRSRRKIKLDLPRRLCHRSTEGIYTLQVSDLQEPETFISIHFKFLNLLSDAYLPCHFHATVPSDTYVHRLCEIITERTKLSATAWYIFCTMDVTHNPPLPPNFVINRLRVVAGTEYNPGVVDLFYTGQMDFASCPVILSDFYCFQSTRRLQRRIQSQEALLEEMKVNDSIVEKLNAKEQINKLQSKISLRFK